LDRSGNERLGCTFAHELAVIPRREADIHTLGLRRRRKTEARRDRAGLRLVAQLADGKLDPGELTLSEHVERVGLVLRCVTSAEAARRASSPASSVPQQRGASMSPPDGTRRIHTPTTSSPRSARIAAATDESTPPLIATKTRLMRSPSRARRRSRRAALRSL